MGYHRCVKCTGSGVMWSFPLNAYWWQFWKWIAVECDRCHGDKHEPPPPRPRNADGSLKPPLVSPGPPRRKPDEFVITVRHTYPHGESSSYYPG